MMRSHTGILFALLGAVTVALLAADLSLGSASISGSSVFRAILGMETDDTVKYIVLNFRLPKAVMAVLAGAGLSAAGLQMQTLFRNPLAGPFVLGVSSGASLGVSLFLLGLPVLGAGAASETLRMLGMAGAAWVGSAAVLAVVLAVAARIKDIMAVLIMGMMFGSAATALVEILQYMSPESALKSFVVWSMGSLGGVTLPQLNVVVPVVLAALTVSLALIKPLNMLMLGENYAGTMGLNVKSVRMAVFVATVMLAGTVTAFCGPIGFIGIAVPHMARMLFAEADHRVLMPASMLTGAAVLLLCDIVSQLPMSDMVLPINSITALVGIPVVVWVIVRNRKVF